MTSRTPIFSRRHTAAAALFTAIALMGSACTGGQPPPQPTQRSNASPTASATASASATPATTAAYKPADATGRAQNVPVPVLPEAAKAETKEGLIAFAKHWYTLLNFAYETGDFRPMDAVTEKTCALCSKVRPGIEEWNSGGRWIAGGLVTPKGAYTEFVKTAGGEYQVTTQLEQSPGALYRPDSSVEKSVTASQVLADIMTIRFKEGRWIAVNVDRIKA